MKGVFIVLAVAGLLWLAGIAQADVFNLGQGLTNLETVAVSDAGNAADTRYGYGSVPYAYNIGKYEVTAAQYCDFLNHKANVSDPYGLYSSNMWNDGYGCKIQQNGSAGRYTYSVAANWANKPVNYVTFWDACRFANWLGNGQGNGDTETGAYTLNGYNGVDGRNIQRNANWAWAITSEDEWYKAAYYKGEGTDAGYWDYPTKSDTISPSMANYNLSNLDHTTDVGSYPSYSSAYGTLDQAGNIAEMNEASTYVNGCAYRGLRGGTYYGHESPQAWCSEYHDLTGATDWIGFRVVQAVPEPSSIIALLVGLAGILGVTRCRA